MNENVENLVLEHLRAIRSDMSKMADWIQTLTVEMPAIRQHLAGADHTEIARIKHRLDRIEKRLELVD